MNKYFPRPVVWSPSGPVDFDGVVDVPISHRKSASPSTPPHLSPASKLHSYVSTIVTSAEEHPGLNSRLSIRISDSSEYVQPSMTNLTARIPLIEAEKLK